MRFHYDSTGTATITYLEVNIYATITGTLGTAADYTINVYLPTYNGGYVAFGNNYSGMTHFCTCTSSFTVGITAYGAVSNLNSLTFASQQKNTRSNVEFIFGANSYRDAFYSTSTYLFNFGFLTTPCENPYENRGNFRCMIY